MAKRKTSEEYRGLPNLIKTGTLAISWLPQHHKLGNSLVAAPSTFKLNPTIHTPLYLFSNPAFT